MTVDTRAGTTTTTLEAPAEEVLLFPAVQGGAVGYIDSEGRWIIPPQFSSASRFSGGLAIATVDEGHGSLTIQKYGVIDSTGTWVIQPRFTWCGEFSEGLAPVQLESRGRYGYIDRTGKLVIPPKFEKPGPLDQASDGQLVFSDGLALFAAEGGSPWGYMDAAGAVVVEPRFDSASAFAGGYAAVRGGQESYFIDKTGRRAFPSQDYAAAGPFSEGLAPVSVTDTDGTRYGFIDTAGRMVIEPQFGLVGQFSEGLAMFGLGGRSAEDALYGFINTSGEPVIPPKFDYLYYFGSSGMSDEARAFSEGLALVTFDHGESWAYIDKNGEITIKPRDSVLPAPFRNGLALLENGDLYRTAGEWRWEYIDKSGKTVWEEGRQDTPPS